MKAMKLAALVLACACASAGSLSCAHTGGYDATRQLEEETMDASTISGESVLATPAGDVNADGDVTAADALLLREYLLKISAFDRSQGAAADRNSDGKITAMDLALLKRHLLTEPASYTARYEAESATISGGNSISSDADASGGKVVGNFAADTDTVAFAVEVPADGYYSLTLTAKGVGGNKTNNVLVDGEAVGSFVCGSTVYESATVRGVFLRSGTHTITVTKSWGWILLDCLNIEKVAGISNSSYEVSDRLINPNADAAAQTLFSYLCDSYGTYTLSGQVCNDGVNGDEFKSIYAITGKYPAICGLDFMDYAPSRVARGAKGYAVDTALAFHQQGGIVTFCWHWNAPDQYLKEGTDANGNPRWWQGFSTANVSIDIDAIMNGRDAAGKALLDADIAEIAKQINIMRDAGVPILWRPLHEASGGWFWWGAKGAAPYKQFWIYLYEQLTNVYGCSNLIWVWNGQSKEWYPGDEYVDVIGEDVYADAHNYNAQNAKFNELLEYPCTNKLTAMTENGVVFDIDNVIATNARWAWFATWCGEFVTRNGAYSDAYTEASIMKKTYQSEAVITLDELPWNK